jgi:hypothetical protein
LPSSPLASCFSSYNSPSSTAFSFPRPLLDYGPPFNDLIIARPFTHLSILNHPYPRRPYAQQPTPSFFSREFHSSSLRPLRLPVTPAQIHPPLSFLPACPCLHRIPLTHPHPFLLIHIISYFLVCNASPRLFCSTMLTTAPRLHLASYILYSLPSVPFLFFPSLIS